MNCSCWARTCSKGSGLSYSVEPIIWVLPYHSKRCRKWNQLYFLLLQSTMIKGKRANNEINSKPVFMHFWFAFLHLKFSRPRYKLWVLLPFVFTFRHLTHTKEFLHPAHWRKSVCIACCNMLAALTLFRWRALYQAKNTEHITSQELGSTFFKFRCEYSTISRSNIPYSYFEYQYVNSKAKRNLFNIVTELVTPDLCSL